MLVWMVVLDKIKINTLFVLKYTVCLYKNKQFVRLKMDKLIVKNRQVVCMKINSFLKDWQPA
jgi:hypothetical protein